VSLAEDILDSAVSYANALNAYSPGQEVARGKIRSSAIESIEKQLEPITEELKAVREELQIKNQLLTACQETVENLNRMIELLPK
jgi:prefoldin subunit 5